MCFLRWFFFFFFYPQVTDEAIGKEDYNLNIIERGQCCPETGFGWKIRNWRLRLFDREKAGLWHRFVDWVEIYKSDSFFLSWTTPPHESRASKASEGRQINTSSFYCRFVRLCSVRVKGRQLLSELEWKLQCLLMFW